MTRGGPYREAAKAASPLRDPYLAAWRDLGWRRRGPFVVMLASYTLECLLLCLAATENSFSVGIPVVVPLCLLTVLALHAWRSSFRCPRCEGVFEKSPRGGLSKRCHTCGLPTGTPKGSDEELPGDLFELLDRIREDHGVDARWVHAVHANERPGRLAGDTFHAFQLAGGSERRADCSPGYAYAWRDRISRRVHTSREWPPGIRPR